MLWQRNRSEFCEMKVHLRDAEVGEVERTTNAAAKPSGRRTWMKPLFGTVKVNCELRGMQKGGLKHRWVIYDIAGLL